MSALTGAGELRSERDRRIEGLIAKNWALTLQLDKALNRIVEQNKEICKLREKLG